MNDLDYCRNLARENAYGEYLCVLTLAPAFRSQALALLALDVELRQVADKVAEEMMAHIRYAWWRESLASLEKPRDHPVLRALSASQLTYSVMEPMIEKAQAAWPNASATHDTFHTAVKMLLKGDVAQLTRWRKSLAVAQKHGQGRNWWLAVKMLFI